MPAQRDPTARNSRYRDGNGRYVSAQTVVALPAAGCDLPVPPMPKGRAWSKDERARWRELWRSPQATQWDDTAAGTVAVLIVYESAILAGTASAWQAQECRHASEALGLTPKAMLTLGWRILEEES